MSSRLDWQAAPERNFALTIPPMADFGRGATNGLSQFGSKMGFEVVVKRHKAKCSMELNILQQHNANRLNYFSLLPFGSMANRTEARQKLRRDNFAKLKKERFKSSVELSNALGEGFSPSYISQLLGGHRGIGDDVADKIETRLDLKKGYLDDAGVDKDRQAEWDKIVWLWEHADDEVRLMLSLLTDAMYKKKKSEIERKMIKETNAGHGNNESVGVDAGGVEHPYALPLDDN